MPFFCRSGQAIGGRGRGIAARRCQGSAGLPACLTGTEDTITALQRFRLPRRHSRARWRRALRSCAVPAERASRCGSGAAGPSPPDAFLVANTQMALGVLDELLARGIRVDVDFGIITFNEAPWSPVIVPPMTVAAQPAYQIGSDAARPLLSRIDGSGGPPAQRSSKQNSSSGQAPCGIAADLYSALTSWWWP